MISIQISAVNEIGVGDPTASPVVTAKYPFNPPCPPECPLVRDVTRKSMTVTWSEPSDDGGSVINGYYLEMRTGVTGPWVKINKEPFSGDTLSHKLSNLSKGKEYSFRYDLNNTDASSFNFIVTKIQFGFIFVTMADYFEIKSQK